MSEQTLPKAKKSVALSGIAAGNTALCTVGRSGNEFARKCLQLLLILIICDYEGAKSRGKPTSFGSLIEEVVKYYSVPQP